MELKEMPVAREPPAISMNHVPEHPLEASTPAPNIEEQVDLVSDPSSHESVQETPEVSFRDSGTEKETEGISKAAVIVDLAQEPLEDSIEDVGSYSIKKSKKDKKKRKSGLSTPAEEIVAPQYDTMQKSREIVEEPPPVSQPSLLPSAKDVTASVMQEKPLESAEAFPLGLCFGYPQTENCATNPRGLPEVRCSACYERVRWAAEERLGFFSTSILRDRGGAKFPSIDKKSGRYWQHLHSWRERLRHLRKPAIDRKYHRRRKGGCLQIRPELLSHCCDI